MKTLKKIMFVILAVGVLFTSCKKSSGPVSTTYTVKYEVIWTAPLNQQSTLNAIFYSNATGNPQMASNISGTSWSNTVTYQNTVSSEAVAINAEIITLQPGTCTVNIYVNGALKSTNSSNGISAGLNGITAFVVEASCTL